MVLLVATLVLLVPTVTLLAPMGTAPMDATGDPAAASNSVSANAPRSGRQSRNATIRCTP